MMCDRSKTPAKENDQRKEKKEDGTSITKYSLVPLIHTQKVSTASTSQDTYTPSNYKFLVVSKTDNQHLGLLGRLPGPRSKIALGSKYYGLDLPAR